MPADPSPAIAIMPHHVKPRLRPGRVALDALVWPRGRPARLQGAHKTLRDLTPDDHLVVFTTDALHLRPWTGTPAKLSVMVLEPRAIHGRHMALLRLTHRRFHRVLTSNPGLLSALPNGILFPLGCTWVGDWTALDLTKTRACSLIASAKRSLEGHALRHDTAAHIADHGLDVDVMGGGYKPFALKSDGLAPYRFSVVIENVREPNYFTEKLIDAVLCRTVPIYWGCPNLGEFMDTSGMVLCEDGAAIRAALNDLSPERYQSLLPGLARAVPQAASYADIFARAADAILGPPGQDRAGQTP
ncbi:glycosyltransferase family 10 domain-containing protein [Roseovarius aestuariivivens]|uniref:glycosyltransferase family 10 domain-containing protein n=1 Tax=Roseovarius aestuariivivens TaxID=1888910 RepID=UPI0010806277|nr:glycosyltransferase family 10 [Roseovarius aestuariivivens]